MPCLRDIARLVGLAAATLLPAALGTGILLASAFRDMAVAPLAGWSAFFAGWAGLTAGLHALMRSPGGLGRLARGSPKLLGAILLAMAPAVAVGFIAPRMAVEWLGVSFTPAGLATAGFSTGIMTATLLTWLFLKSDSGRAFIRWVIAILSTATVVAVALAARPEAPSGVHDTARSLERLALAARTHFTDHPERVFVNYEELVGPGKRVAHLSSLGGERYQSMFPLRADFLELRVDRGDGLRVILWLPSDGPISRLWQDKSGRFRFLGGGQRPFMARGRDNRIEIPLPSPDSNRTLERYVQRRNGARHETHLLTRLLDGRTMRTELREGVPNGEFQAHYGDGTLWSHGKFIEGKPVGRFPVLNRNGSEIHFHAFDPH